MEAGAGIGSEPARSAAVLGPPGGRAGCCGADRTRHRCRAAFCGAAQHHKSAAHRDGGPGVARPGDLGRRRAAGAADHDPARPERAAVLAELSARPDRARELLRFVLHAGMPAGGPRARCRGARAATGAAPGPGRRQRQPERHTGEYTSRCPPLGAVAPQRLALAAREPRAARCGLARLPHLRGAAGQGRHRPHRGGVSARPPQRRTLGVPVPVRTGVRRRRPEAARDTKGGGHDRDRTCAAGEAPPGARMRSRSRSAGATTSP